MRIRASGASNARRFGASRVSATALSRQAARSQLASLVLLRADGTVIGRSPGTPAATVRALEAKAEFVRAALSGKSFALSNVMAGRDGSDTIQFAQTFSTP
ncbi:MAG TPA: hypothetical protein VNA28_02235 [Solirubrobacteraceae bacterium]|nr:hypothetical protein [Solirubrobacteraceae bacterium]